MNTAKDWVDILAAFSTPAVATAAVLISYTNYRLAKRKRKDELFDKRYAFYKQFCRFWLSKGTGAGPDVDPEIDPEVLAVYSDEALFLFGRDIQKHINSLPLSGHEGSPFYPDESFIEPFKKYLTLEDEDVLHLLKNR